MKKASSSAQAESIEEAHKFWTKVKTVTQRWPDGGASGDSAFVIPTTG